MDPSPGRCAAPGGNPRVAAVQELLQMQATDAYRAAQVRRMQLASADHAVQSPLAALQQARDLRDR